MQSSSWHPLFLAQSRTASSFCVSAALLWARHLFMQASSTQGEMQLYSPSQSRVAPPTHCPFVHVCPAEQAGLHPVSAGTHWPFVHVCPAEHDGLHPVSAGTHWPPWHEKPAEQAGSHSPPVPSGTHWPPSQEKPPEHGGSHSPVVPSGAHSPLWQTKPSEQAGLQPPPDPLSPPPSQLRTTSKEASKQTSKVFITSRFFIVLICRW